MCVCYQLIPCPCPVWVFTTLSFGVLEVNGSGFVRLPGRQSVRSPGLNVWYDRPRACAGTSFGIILDLIGIPSCHECACPISLTSVRMSMCVSGRQNKLVQRENKEKDGGG